MARASDRDGDHGPAFDHPGLSEEHSLSAESRADTGSAVDHAAHAATAGQPRREGLLDGAPLPQSPSGNEPYSVENAVPAAHRPDQEAASRNDAPPEPEWIAAAEDASLGLEPVAPETALTVAVANAGLVLFHPFLPEFFAQLGWRAPNDSEPLDSAFGRGARMRAALALEQLATGEPLFPESRLALNKLLCGLPFEQPAPPALLFDSVEERDRLTGAVAELLDAVTTHWSALGTVSHDGFRQAFVRRKGLLIREDGGWRLRVEPAAHDLLLSRLPWGLSMIRFSWMAEPLMIDWTP
jgi:hypothetical protein